MIHLAITAHEQGATLVNYCPVTALSRGPEGYVGGVVANDLESGEELTLPAKVVVNATGAFSDAVRRMGDPAAEPMIAPSQGVHLVFDGSFLPRDHAVMVPRTSDGRVMFAIPWHGHTLVGTTDTPVEDVPLEPRPLSAEIDFIISTAGLYLSKAPSRSDILSTFSGIRPLVKSGQGTNTAALSRDHSIHIDASGLITIAGGKWTTYRNMAEDCVDQAATLGSLDDRPCVTKQLRIHGFHQNGAKFGPLAPYGSDASAIQDLIRGNPQLASPLHPALPYAAAQVVWAARHEMARTVEDVLSRRTRALVLNARAAMQMAPAVADLMAAELGRDSDWVAVQLDQFRDLAAGYLPG